MDRVIVKDVSGAVQKHDCQRAEVRGDELIITNNTKTYFAYNRNNLISYSITTISGRFEYGGGKTLGTNKKQNTNDDKEA